MLIELTNEEFELVEHSVAMRLQTWRWTLEYLETGEADGMVEECHKISEAQWIVAQYERLHEKLTKRASERSTLNA
jgi:hypothetical protein